MCHTLADNSAGGRSLQFLEVNMPSSVQFFWRLCPKSRGLDPVLFLIKAVAKKRKAVEKPREHCGGFRYSDLSLKRQIY